jgi:hypothetical protein
MREEGVVSVILAIRVKIAEALERVDTRRVFEEGMTGH